jgi:hypothetical protein
MHSTKMRNLFMAVAVLTIVATCTLRAFTEASPKAVTVTRIFSGPDGLTHINEIELKLSTYAQGHGDAAQSDPTKAARAYVVRLPPGYFSDWHNADHRRYVIPLTGLAELEIGNGEKVRTQISRLYLAEDLTGKGHTFRVVGESDWVALFVDLDQ